jgi:hypothetical protein
LPIQKPTSAQIGRTIRRGIILLLSFASLIEAVVGFIPFPDAVKSYASIFFLGLAFIGISYEIITSLFYNFTKENNLQEQINNGLELSKISRINSGELLGVEGNLYSKFGISNNIINSPRFLIIIFTKCFDTNEKTFINTIWNNLKNHNRYIYITPNNDFEFIYSLINIFSVEGYDDLTNVYRKVTQNIVHISSPDLFIAAPQFLDLCLYCKEDGVNKLDNMFGYYCCQDEPRVDAKGNKQYFYEEMSLNMKTELYNKYKDTFETERIKPSYVSIKVEKFKSPIHGFGMRACEQIQKDEVLFIKGGWELLREEMASSGPANSYLPINDKVCFAAKTLEEEEIVKLYINHSCNPNCYMADAQSIKAMHDIEVGEEITMDYAFVDNEDYEFDCRCSKKNCRHKITGRDWQTVKTKANKKYFSPYLREKKAQT